MLTAKKCLKTNNVIYLGLLMYILFSDSLNWIETELNCSNRNYEKR